MIDDPSLMITVCTEDAEVISTSPNHLAWLGRDQGGVIGHKCSEWAHPDSWDKNWHCLQHSISTGDPVQWTRIVVDTNGASLIGRMTVQPILRKNGHSAVMCWSKCESLIQTHDRASQLVRSIDIADYVGEMIRALAKMTSECNLPMLTQSLEDIAGEAVSVSKRLSATLIKTKLN